ncbi:unnamed protein product, partial [Ixodes hexagonus]
ARGTSLLEVGSGPTVCASFLSSVHFNDIVLSGLFEDNRLELNKWLDKSEDALDWTSHAEEVAALKGHSDIKKGALEIQERARSSIRKVVPCHVLAPGVVPEEHMGTFDAVLSCNCLEAAAVDHESFQRVVSNVGALVKPGDLLVLAGIDLIGGKDGYSVGNVDFLMAKVTENVLEQAAENNGFQIQVYRAKDVAVVLEMPEAFTFVLAARKL